MTLSTNKKSLNKGLDALELIHALMHQYRSQQYQVLRDCPHDITHMESKVLSYFDRHPGGTQAELAKHSGRDKAQLARLIKGLREKGMLAVEADSEDKRNLKLTLTEQGQAVQVALHQQAQRLGVKALAGLSEAERQLLIDLLQRLQSNLDGSE